ncbi:MAG: DUF3343 domain-containing protein [Oscillospiraceae bacterium]
MNYIATFHTHFGAMTFKRKAEKLNIPCQMAPVPRKLSASCGVCVMFNTEIDVNSLNSKDLYGIYSIDNDTFNLIFENE